MKRRSFVASGSVCLAHLMWVNRLAAGTASGFPVVAAEPWGSLEEISPGIWALISTPLEDRTTLCNGGIVSGATGTVVFEAFGSERGAVWMAEQARALTGRWPTHVVLSHFHGDHTNGLAGMSGVSATPAIMTTQRTVQLVQDTDVQRPPVNPIKAQLLRDTDVLNGSGELDLGGRSIRYTSRDGHTPSDVTLSVEGGRAVFCGDLVWNNMFPNYRDATPSRLSTAVRALASEPGQVFVPGHGQLAQPADMERYLRVIDAVEAAGRAAHAAGTPAADAAEAFRLPAGVGEWMRFNPRYYEVAIGAWLRELGG